MTAGSLTREQEVERARLAQFRKDRWQNIAGQFGAAPFLIAIAWGWADHSQLVLFAVLHHLLVWCLAGTFVLPLRSPNVQRVPRAAFGGIVISQTFLSSVLWFDAVAARGDRFVLGAGIVIFACAAGSLATLGAHPKALRFALTALLMPYGLSALWFGHPGVALGTAFFYLVVVVVAVSQIKRGQDELIELRLDDAARAATAEQHAQTDPLTHLLNRHGLAGLDGTATSGSVAAFFVDLDGFKAINDSYGHASGDVVLASVARRLEDAAGPTRTVARLGGDEFLILADGVDEQDAGRLLARLEDSLVQPVALPRFGPVKVQASIGMALAEADTFDLAHLLRASDSAMYDLKYAFRSAPGPLGDHDVAARREVVEAIRDGQIELWFQPIVRLESLDVAAVEGLARWRHPERGLLLPGEFLPLVDRYSLHGVLFDAVLEQALRFCARTIADGHRVAASVNLAASNLRDPDLPLRVKRALETHGVPARSLVVELTEGEFVAQGGPALDTLLALHSMGVRISMDDLGTGYSSLERLSTLPLSAVKLDRSFVQRSGDHATDRIIVKAMIDLAALLDLTVVGEGIETEEQLAMLRSMGCDMAQGWLFKKAAPADEIVAMLASGKRLDPLAEATYR